MKSFVLGLTLAFLPFSSAVQAAPESRLDSKLSASVSVRFDESASRNAQQNLIGEVASIDRTGGKMVIQTESKTSVTVTFSEQTAIRRVQPGQTSLANAEQIKITDVNVGDRVLIPGGALNEKTPVSQIIVMSRAAIDERRSQEIELRRGRTTVGRITTVNPEKKEFTIQARGRGTGETLTVSAANGVKFLRYAPDSLRIGDAVPGSFSDLRIGDQVRILGDRPAGTNRITAEEIVFGSVTRLVGIITDVNTARGEIVVKNNQTGQTSTVAVGKNTTLRRITPEVSQTLRQRLERRNARRDRNDGGRTPDERWRNRSERRGQTGIQQSERRSPGQMFDNLPAITLNDLKKGDAVLITGTNSAAGALQVTAVSVISGEGELLQFLQRAQGAGNGSSNMSPGLPGNVSGGNAADDDEPQ